MLSLLMIISSGMMVACKNDSEKEIMARLVKNSYSVYVEDDEMIEEWLGDYGVEFNASKIETFITGEHTELDKIVHVVFCENNSAARKLKKAVKKQADNIADEWDWAEDEFKCKRVGNVVYFGHVDAVEIARG